MRAHTLSELSADPLKKFPAPMPAEKLSPKAAYAKFCGIRLERGVASAFVQRKIGTKSKERILNCNDGKMREERDLRFEQCHFWEEVTRIYTNR